MSRQGWLWALALALPFWIALGLAFSACQPATAITPLAWARLPETGLRTFPGSTEPPAVASAHPAVVPSATATPTGHVVPPFVGAKGAAGVATWQPGSGYWASAGPVLRALGIDAGDVVEVCVARNCIPVRVAPGGCWCKPRSGIPDLLDLSLDAFTHFAPSGRGWIHVVVTHG